MPTSTGGRYHVASVMRPPTYEATAIAAVSADSTQPADHRRPLDVDLDGVDEDRHIDHRDHERGADHEVDDERGAHVATAEDRALDQRVIRSALVPHERDRGDHGDRVQPAQIGAARSGQLVETRHALDLGTAEQREVE